MKLNQTKMFLYNSLLILFILTSSFFIYTFNSLYYLVFILLIFLTLFKKGFGFEKDNHRYTKDIRIDFLIILLIFFIIYYLLGLTVGFVKTDNLFSIYGFFNYIIPYSAIIILKENLRYQILSKTKESKFYFFLISISLSIVDVIYNINIYEKLNIYDIFIFCSVTLLPAISSSFVCSYIAKKLGPKLNIMWMLIFNLYGVLLPIVPDLGIYVGAIIKLVFPLLLAYNVYSFFTNRQSKKIKNREKNFEYIYMFLFSIVTLNIVCLTSGFFRHLPIAISSGSMNPHIHKGDIVIIDQKIDYKDLKTGDVIAYEYNSIIVVHRIVKIEKVTDAYYFYTKGDANKEKDNYIVYSDTILGLVDNKIPLIGYFAVWLNEL